MTLGTVRAHEREKKAASEIVWCVLPTGRREGRVGGRHGGRREEINNNDRTPKVSKGAH